VSAVSVAGGPPGAIDPISNQEKRMAGTTALLNRIRRICLALPDTKETPTWGKPHFRVGEKIFAGFGEQDGRPTLGMKLVAGHATRAKRA
jgi:hypothetical protein